MCGCKEAKKSSCSWRTFEGPQPNLPSFGKSDAGIVIAAMLYILLPRNGASWGRARVVQYCVEAEKGESRARNGIGWLPKSDEFLEVLVTDLIDTTEMYLRTILELEEEGIVPLRARISERLGHSGPTVSQTIARMERDGLVVVSDDRHLELTADGRVKAVRVMRKHRLAERLLADVIGLEWEYVHEEACRWEHVMSEQVERKLLGMLGNPVDSPYGNPIPGLEELGLRPAMLVSADIVSATVPFEDGTECYTARLRRLAEPAQLDPEQLRLFHQVGLKPGAIAEFCHRGQFIAVTVEGQAQQSTIELPLETAAHLFVSRVF